MKRALAAAAVVLFYSQDAFAHEFDYIGFLTGSTTGTGIVHIHTDLDVITMNIQVSFSGLSGPVTGAQIHGRTTLPGLGTAGIAVPLPLFPLGVTSGTDDETLNIGLASTYSSSFITANGGTPGTALDAFTLGLDENRMYVEIQTANFPNGEIRGFVTLVPEPGSLALLGCGSALLLRRRRNGQTC